jgi:hypothetical protein
VQGSASRVALALGAALVTFSLLEIVARVVNPSVVPMRYLEEERYDKLIDADVGYRMRPSTQFHARKPNCYDVVYTTDSFGRRLVASGAPSSAARPGLILFRCSYTFGEGLADEDTLQYQLRRDFDVVNYAAYGYGVQNTLALLRSGRLEHELPPGDGLGVFIVYPFHFRRSLVGSDERWLFSSPYFELAADGSLLQFASMSAEHPLRAAAYRALGAVNDRSALLSWMKVRWPPSSANAGAAKLTAAMLIASAHLFEQHFNGRFVVVMNGSFGYERIVRSFLAELREAGVAVLDYSTMKYNPADFVCASDGHPNGGYNARLAQRLRVDLPAVHSGD